jgi:sugar/nucleoside kinase (ribokinase family)
MARPLVAVILLLQSIHSASSLIVASSQSLPRESNFALQLSSSLRAETMTTNSQEKVVLVVGACGLDRLMTVSSYPQADSKVRSTAYHEIGGGNAANTASAMALLSSASIFRNEHFCIKLLTKVGDDYIGQQLKDELEKCGVDTTYVCTGEKGSTTSFTSVIVSQDEQTRTCIHSPGTSGNFDASDIESLDDLFTNVVHLHSDSRLAEVSLMLAEEAHERNIPVSVDIEKDRKVPILDHLLVMADTVFTNSTQIQDYLERWTANLESEHNRRSLPAPVISVVGDDKYRIKETCALGLGPSHFFQRWYSDQPSRNKEVVITK